MCDNIELLFAYILVFLLGINNSANAIGLAYSAKIDYRILILTFTVFVFLGALFSFKVSSTVHYLSYKPFLALIITAILFVISNYFRVPVSLHTLIISSLVGLSLKNFDLFFKIVLSWIISPLLAMFLAYILYNLYNKIKIPILKKIRIIKILLILSSGIVAFNLGSNDLPTILGVFTTSLKYHLIGAVFLSLGALFGKNISKELGKIINLDIISAFIAQFSGGLAILLFTYFGIPVSTTYGIVGATVGVGLTRGIKTIKFSVLKKFLIWWITAPILAFILGAIIRVIYSVI
ncbi:inorganic phosphate transporter [Methanocaldococcus indicus]|uniref:inorganic phosphate transporter n=1 Tax=Methanocaldococcus indicus TaxID=213231 RepID=UPI003C6DAD6A